MTMKRDRALRQHCLERDDFTCRLCGLRLDEAFLHADHVIPLWAGGKDELDNLQTLDSRCHKRKTAREATQRARGPRWRRRVGDAVGRLVGATLLLSLAWMCGLYLFEGPASAVAFATTARDIVGHTLFLMIWALSMRWLMKHAPGWMRAPALDAVPMAADDPHRGLRTVQDRVAALVAAVEPAAVPVVDWTESGAMAMVTIPAGPGSTLRDGNVRIELQDALNAALGLDWTLDYSPVRDRCTYWDRPDPLSPVIPALPVPAAVDWSGAVLGTFEDGSLLRVPRIGTHVLAAGSTGAGKGSLLWSSVRGLAPGIRDGLVRVYGIDPKSMELHQGREMFYVYADGDVLNPTGRPFEEYEQLVLGLETAVTDMRAQARRLKASGVEKWTTASLENPYNLVIIDEVADLTAYCPDTRLKTRANSAIAVLTSQGRAAGFQVLALLQDPGKDILKFRNLFNTRIALRLGEANEVAMVLSEGARARGARADRIPMALPGVGYVLVDGDPTPRRFRAPLVTRAEIASMAREYAVLSL